MTEISKRLKTYKDAEEFSGKVVLIKTDSYYVAGGVRKGEDYSKRDYKCYAFIKNTQMAQGLGSCSMGVWFDRLRECDTVPGAGAFTDKHLQDFNVVIKTLSEEEKKEYLELRASGNWEFDYESVFNKQYPNNF